MHPLNVVFLVISIVLSLMTYRRAMDMGWGVVTAIILGLVPVTATYVMGFYGMGVYGVFAGATLVGGLYKAGG
ncbi:MAG: hypothetical protein U0746_20675 [Gemmataceae bacterium]